MKHFSKDTQLITKKWILNEVSDPSTALLYAACITLSETARFPSSSQVPSTASRMWAMTQHRSHSRFHSTRFNLAVDCLPPRLSATSWSRNTRCKNKVCLFSFTIRIFDQRWWFRAIGSLVVLLSNQRSSSKFAELKAVRGHIRKNHLASIGTWNHIQANQVVEGRMPNVGVSTH